MKPTSFRRKLIRELNHGIDVDEQQYDSEHCWIMRELVRKLAYDVLGSLEEQTKEEAERIRKNSRIPGGL